MGFLVNSSLQDQVLQELESSFDYGVKLGLGYDIHNFFVELSAYQGVEPTLEIQVSENLKRNITNTTLQLSLGYQFN